MNLRVAAPSTAPPPYLETIGLIERLHHHVLDAVKAELQRVGDHTLTPAQAFMLYAIGDQEFSARQLMTRGCYFGTNVDYNLKKLVRLKMVSHGQNPDDGREIRIKLTDKGHGIHNLFCRLFDRHLKSVEHVTGIKPPDFALTNKCLRQIDLFMRGTIY